MLRANTLFKRTRKKYKIWIFKLLTAEREGISDDLKNVHLKEGITIPPSEITIEHDVNVPMIPEIIFFGLDDIDTIDYIEYYFADTVPKQLSSPDQLSYYAMPNFRTVVK